MSIVGPRPALFNQDDQISLRTKSGAYLLVPGITGWAPQLEEQLAGGYDSNDQRERQLNGRDDISIVRKVELDTWYLHNHSFWLDIKIIFMTVANVFRSSGVSH